MSSGPSSTPHGSSLTVELTEDEVRDVMLALAPVPWHAFDAASGPSPGLTYTQFGGRVQEMLKKKLADAGATW